MLDNWKHAGGAPGPGTAPASPSASAWDLSSSSTTSKTESYNNLFQSNATANATHTNSTPQCQCLSHSQDDRDSQLLALDLTHEKGPSKFVGLFVWGKDESRLCQPLLSLPLAVCTPDSAGAGVQDPPKRGPDGVLPSSMLNSFDRSQKPVQLLVQTGTGTFSSHVSIPSDVDLNNLTAKDYHLYVRKLCFDADSACRYGVDLPELIIPIGVLKFQSQDDQRQRGPVSYPGYYSVFISILPTRTRTGIDSKNLPASYGNTKPKSKAKSPGPSPLPSPAASPRDSYREQTSSQKLAANGGVWIMFDDFYADDEVDEDEDEYQHETDQDENLLKEAQAYAHRRDQAFNQTFGRLADHQGKTLPSFDIACVLDDWKDLFRTSSSSERCSPPSNPVQMLRHSAVMVRPYLEMVRSQDVAYRINKRRSTA